MPTIRAKQEAFTLIEVLVVVAILGALSAIAIPSYQAYVERTRVGKAVMEISMIAGRLKLFWEDARQYPANLSDIMSPVPLDPWGNPYEYLAIDISPNPPNRGSVRKDKNQNPLNSDFDLYSMGKDGRSVKPLTGAHARDDIVRADNGRFVGLASDH